MKSSSSIQRFAFVGMVGLCSCFMVAAQLWAEPTTPDPLVTRNLEQMRIQTRKLVKEKEFKSAVSMAEQMVELAEKSFGLQDWQTGNARLTLGGVYFLKQDYTKAEPLVQNALSIFEKAGQVKHQRGILALRSLARIYAAQGEDSRAKVYQKRADQVGDMNIGGLDENWRNFKKSEKL